MYPGYKHVDPYYYPHQRNPSPSPYNQYPNWETRPPQMRVDHSPPTSPYGPWPYNSNPAEFNTCSNHNCPPGFYSYGPPYPHYPPPSQLYYHGPCPPHPESYPPYFVPPPHYPVNQAQYDYDKGKAHCCRCSDHVCQWRDSNNVKIEEQKPETEQSNNSKNTDLIRLPNYPYPVVWFPTNYLKDKESTSTAEAQPENWTRWVPLDMNSLKGLKQGGDDKGCVKSEQKAAPFSWPIIWVPGYDKQDDAVKHLKDSNYNPETSEVIPSRKIKIIPLDFGENENNVNKPAPKKDKAGSHGHPEAVTEKEVNGKTIPVVEMKQSNEKKLSLDENVRANIHEKKDDNGAKSFGSKQSSPVKSLKLPPVCLRVDPLRKKSVNGSLRSPSPPNHKEKESAQKKKEQMQTENTPKEKTHKAVPVVFVKGIPQKLAQELREKKYDGEGKDENKSVERKAFEEGKLEKEKLVVEDNKECKEKTSGGKVEERKQQRDFSETDAATLIQSAYRGFEVRKWQPLQKLRKIMRVREQVGEVRKRIESFGASSEMDAKQSMIIGETIMNLLLQLDTIQGLHPSVREARKSVAKELICLQEKLDSLGKQSTLTDESAVMVEEQSSNKDAEEQASLGASEQVCVQSSDENLVTPSTAVQCKYEEIPEGVEVKESASETSMEVKDNTVSATSYGYKDVPDAGLFLVSESACEIPSIAVEEAIEPPALLVAEAEGAPSASREAPVEKEAALSARVQASDSFSGEDSKPDYVQEKTSDESAAAVKDKGDAEDSNLASTAINTEELPLVQDVSQGKSSINSSEGGDVDAVAVSQETESTAEVAAPAEPITEENVAKCDASAPLPQNIEADAKQEELETAQFVKENVSNSQAAAAPVVQNIEADIKHEEPQTPPSVEESNLKENASEVKVADDNTSIAALVHPETADLGTSTEPEKNLEMHLIEEASTLVQDSVLFCEGDRKLGENIKNGTEMSSMVESNSNESVEPKQEAAHFEGPTSEPTIEAPVKDEGYKGPEEEGGESTDEVISAPTVNSIRTVKLSNEEKLTEENEKLREMLQKLLDSGKEHLAVISDLRDRVKDLERKLAKKKRVKVMMNKPKRPPTNAVARH